MVKCLRAGDLEPDFKSSALPFPRDITLILLISYQIGIVQGVYRPRELIQVHKCEAVRKVLSHSKHYYLPLWSNNVYIKIHFRIYLNNKEQKLYDLKYYDLFYSKCLIKF